MDNIARLPQRAAIRREAEAWIIRLDGIDSPSPADLAALRAWLARSPIHRQELHAANQFWANNILAELAAPLDDALISSGPMGSAWRPVRPRMLAIGLAATVILAVALFWSLPFYRDSHSNGLYVTAVGQQNTVVLADGTEVQLNTNSQMQVEYDGNFRNVRLLQGEAHFSVAKNPRKPFRVYAINNRIQAVGTAFTVFLNNKDLSVLVTEGRVSLASLATTGTAIAEQSPADDTAAATDGAAGADRYGSELSQELALLDARESITIAGSAGFDAANTDIRAQVQEVSNSDLERRESWRKGLLIFNGETLEQVVAEVSRYSTVAIEIPDPSVRALQVGGRYKIADMDGLLRALETNFNLKAEYLGYNRVLLSRPQG